MKKNISIVILVVLTICISIAFTGKVSSQSSFEKNLVGGTWEIIEHKYIIYPDREVVNYQKGKTLSNQDYSKLRATYYEDGTGFGIDVVGNSGEFTWSLEGDNIIVGFAASKLMWINENEYAMKSKVPSTTIDSEGNEIKYDLVVTSRRIPEEDCLEEITHSNEVLDSDSYKAREINSKAVIEPNSRIVYKAEDGIKLGDGFKVEKGGKFEAELQPCSNSTKSRNKQEEKNTNSIEIEDREKTSFSIFPNPASDVINIEYYLPSDSQVNIGLFDLNARLIKSFINESQLAGVHKTEQDISEYPLGIYILALQTDKERLSSKVVIQ